jgi:hypothetical protein
MVSGFYDAYNNLYSNYADESGTLKRTKASYNEFYYIRLIQRTIDRENHNNLRPDAKYFLLVNFHQLIIRPLLANDNLFNGLSFYPISNLEDIIEADIKTIIKASKSGLNRTQDEISGHRVMTVINEMWQTLNVTKFDIWG